MEGKRSCTGFGPRLVEQSRLRYLKPDPAPMLNQHKTDSETTSYNPKKVSSFGREALAQIPRGTAELRVPQGQSRGHQRKFWAS